ncbi:MAG: TolC family protein, partial [Nitrospiria bacterium]
AEQALESARIAYTAGRADFSTLIDAEQRLRDARLASDLALADWAERRAELERVVGRDLP